MSDRAPTVPLELRRLRTEAVMTQEELARKSGIGVRTIRDLESGRTRPQPRTLRLLLDALGGAPTERETANPAPPRELPRALTGFAARAPLLEAVVAAVESGAAVVAVHGMAGVGKTSLAVRAAHELAPRYPDGQCFVDFHGFTDAAGLQPDLASVLMRVVRAFNGAERTRPEHLEELTAAYRSALAGKRTLLLFDDVADPALIEALLPGTPGSLVITTSRRDLSTLPDAYAVHLEPLPMREAVAMLETAVAERVTTTEATAIAERCGRLPLALGLAAARLRSRPHWHAEDLLARLADEDLLLDELDTGHRGVAAALRASYRELDAGHRTMLRRLGLVPGGDIDALTAAALCDVDEPTAFRMLEELVDVHLAETRSSGRYRLHDLVRLFATRHAALEDTAPDRDAAFARLIARYLHLAYRAAAKLHPNKRRFAVGAVVHDLGLPGPADQAEALAWFQTERGNLEAAVIAAERAGLAEEAWHLATAFNAFFVHDSDIGPHLAVNRLALAIARSTEDTRKEAYTLGDAGRQLLALGRNGEALDALERSVSLKQRMGAFADAALTLANLGILHRRCGRFAESAETHAAALAQAEQAGDTAAAALIRTNMVVPLLRLGRFHEAEALLAEAERRLDTGDEHNRIRIHAFRGVLTRELGDPARAAAIHRSCLDAYGGEDDAPDATATLIELGEDLLRLDDAAAAVAHLERAVEHAVKLADPSLERAARNDLGRARTALGDTAGAVAQHQRAAAIAAAHQDAYERARASHGLANAARAAGDHEAARLHLEHALARYLACGVPEAAAVAAEFEPGRRPASLPTGRTPPSATASRRR